MWVFISSEIMFFAALIAVALIFRLSTTESGWPNPAEMHVSLGLGMLNTVFLVLSGVTAFAAVNAAREDQPRRAKLMLTVTIVLGLVFLGVKFQEYSTKYRLGLLPSPAGQQIYQESTRQYVSAVDQQLTDLIADMERRSGTAEFAEEDQQRLERLYELKTHMSGFTANFVGRSNDPAMQQVQMNLMAQQIFPNSGPTRGLEEVLTLNLTNLMALRDRMATRLELGQQRAERIREQMSSLEQSVSDQARLGTSQSGTADTIEAEPEKWLGIKQDQLKLLNVEIEKLKLSLEPVQGRVQMLGYFADPEFEQGFNAALGLRLPVVVTNGQAWIGVYLLLTGLHALHLIAGLLVFFWFWPRRLDRHRAAALFVAAMYWQFVDVVWLAIFWLIYF